MTPAPSFEPNKRQKHRKLAAAARHRQCLGGEERICANTDARIVFRFCQGTKPSGQAQATLTLVEIVREAGFVPIDFHVPIPTQNKTILSRLLAALVHLVHDFWLIGSGKLPANTPVHLNFTQSLAGFVRDALPAWVLMRKARHYPHALSLHGHLLM